MKKNLILMMLLLVGAVSMNGQEPTIPEGPKMVVAGNVINTGTIISKIAIDLQAGQIDNKPTGKIKTPYLNVESGALLTNEAGGDICVGVDCGTVPPPADPCAGKEPTISMPASDAQINFSLPRYSASPTLTVGYDDKDNTPIFEWHSSSSPTGEGPAIPDSNADTYSAPTTLDDGTTYYYCVLETDCGLVVSDRFAVTLYTITEYADCSNVPQALFSYAIVTLYNTGGIQYAAGTSNPLIPGGNKNPGRHYRWWPVPQEWQDQGTENGSYTWPSILVVDAICKPL
jgi:hypothetical protein